LPLKACRRAIDRANIPIATLANRIAALEKADEKRLVLLTLFRHLWQVYQFEHHPAMYRHQNIPSKLATSIDKLHRAKTSADFFDNS
jgi:hypothetical protein